MPSRSSASTCGGLGEAAARATRAAARGRAATRRARASASAAATSCVSTSASVDVMPAAWSRACAELLAAARRWPRRRSVTRSPTVSGSRLRARSLNVSRASSGSTGAIVRSIGMTSPSCAFGLPALAIAASHGGKRTTLRSPMSVSGSMVACTSAGSGTSRSIVISTRTWSSSISTASTVPIGDAHRAARRRTGRGPTARLEAGRQVVAVADAAAEDRRRPTPRPRAASEPGHGDGDRPQRRRAVTSGPPGTAATGARAAGRRWRRSPRPPRRSRPRGRRPRRAAGRSGRRRRGRC